MTELTALEESVLAEIDRTYDIPSLRELRSNGVVVSRDNTGHGFYTDVCSYGHSAKAAAQWENVGDAGVELVGMGEGAVMGFVLYTSGSDQLSLEGYQIGDNQGKTVDLRHYNLSELRFSRFV